jgi:putative DNA primase/helicase
MEVSFYGRENAALTEQLCMELAGIFNWSLDGLQRLRERGRFEQPAVSADAIQRMEDLASPIGAFIRDRCRLGHDESVECETLYTAYRHWCDEKGQRAVSDATFGRDLHAARPETRRFRPGTTGPRPHHYAGISVATSWDVRDVNPEEDHHVPDVLGREHRYSGNGSDDNSNKGTPHPDYGYDEFSPIRKKVADPAKPK